MKDYVVLCPNCNSKIVAKPQNYYEDPDFDLGPQTYVVATCAVCFQVLFFRHPYESKDARRGAEVLWPQVDRRLSTEIPESLRLEHDEARTCFKHAAYTAAVVMVRRTLEAVCREHSVTTSPLVKALEEMKHKGLIEGRLLEWAQALRVLGNEGAHFTGRRVARQDADDALALAEAILDYLYVFSAKFNDFKHVESPRLLILKCKPGMNRHPSEHPPVRLGK
jgi:hypothetical protein